MTEGNEMMEYSVSEIVSFSRDTVCIKDLSYVYYLDTGNITDNHIARLQRYENLSELPSRARKVVLPGDIIYSTVRPINRHFGIIPQTCDNLIVSTGFSVIRAKVQYVLPEYLYYLLTSEQTIEFLQSVAEQSTSTYPSIKDSDIASISVKIPSIEKQKQIVGIINPIDRKIQLNNLINNNLFAEIESIFKEVRSSSELEVRPLFELCSFISRGVTPKYVEESEYRVLGQTCVRNHIVSLNNARTLIKKEYGEKTVHKGDILVNSTGVGSLGRVAQIGFDCDKLVADSHITIVRPLEIYREYLGCQLVSMEAEIENMAEGSTGQTELPRSRFAEIEIRIPDEDTLRKFSNIVQPLSNLIYSNLSENEKLMTLRDHILPKLLSGEIDVSGSFYQSK